MKTGDILYFIKPYVAMYNEDYQFNKGDKCRIVIRHSDYNYSIMNITKGDKISHFAHRDMRECLVTESEWRQIQLMKIL